MNNIGVIVDNGFNDDIRVRKEVEILKRNGFNVSVLCFAFDNKEYAPVPKVNITRIKIKKRTKDILFFLFNRFPLYELFWEKEIEKFIQKNSIEILHVHDLYMSKAAYLATKKINNNIPLILDLHENFPQAIQAYNWTKGFFRNFISNPKAWIKKEKQYLGYASKLVVLSKSFKQDLSERYSFINKKNIVVFPNVIDLSRFEKYEVNPKIKKSGRITLMYFGVVAERRGVFETLQVFEKGLKNNLNIDLLIIGPVDKIDRKRFFKEINKPILKDYIKYIPWISLSELVTYMHISDIFLSPLVKNKQHESGVANKIFQYMYGAKPIIVSDCKPQKDLVEAFDCGVSYSTQKEFLEHLKKLVENKGLRDKMGANGFRKLYEEYDNKNYEKIFLTLYNGIDD